MHAIFCSHSSAARSESFFQPSHSHNIAVNYNTLFAFICIMAPSSLILCKSFPFIVQRGHRVCKLFVFFYFVCVLCKHTAFFIAEWILYGKNTSIIAANVIFSSRKIPLFSSIKLNSQRFYHEIQCNTPFDIQYLYCVKTKGWIVTNGNHYYQTNAAFLLQFFYWWIYRRRR